MAQEVKIKTIKVKKLPAFKFKLDGRQSVYSLPAYSSIPMKDLEAFNEVNTETELGTAIYNLIKKKCPKLIKDGVTGEEIAYIYEEWLKASGVKLGE